MKNKFIPDDTINKMLISSTCRFTGQYESENTLLTHAWALNTNYQRSISDLDTPFSRHASLFGFQTSPIEPSPGVVVPDYTYIGNIICSYLALFYGKRFDNHGMIESMGLFTLPNFSQYGTACDKNLPSNSSKERSSLAVPLSLCNFEVLERILLDDTKETKFKQTFTACAKYYLQALQAIEYDSEIAYLHLVTAGEILANYHEYNDKDIIDSVTLRDLNIVENCDNCGKIVGKSFRSKFRSIKRRFVKTICDSIEDDFFDSPETDKRFSVFTKESFEKNIMAAYDLRSQYVHSGIPFGNWISKSPFQTDTLVGQPVVGNKEIAKILKYVPTFIGLERTIRYVLIKFMERNGFKYSIECAKS